MAQRRAITSGPPEGEGRRETASGSWQPQMYQRRSDGSFFPVEPWLLPSGGESFGPRGSLLPPAGASRPSLPGSPSIWRWDPPPGTGTFGLDHVRQQFGIQSRVPAAPLQPPIGTQPRSMPPFTTRPVVPTSPEVETQAQISPTARPSPRNAPLSIESLLRSHFASGTLLLGPGADVDSVVRSFCNCKELVDLRATVIWNTQKTNEHETEIQRLSKLFSSMKADSDKAQRTAPETPHVNEAQSLQSGLTFPARRQPERMFRNMRRENSAPDFITQLPITTVGQSLSSKAMGKQRIGFAPIGEDGRAHFEKKPNMDAFNEVFTKLEAFVRNFCVIPISPSARNWPAQKLVEAIRAHVNVPKAADEMLPDQNINKLVITGIMCHYMTKHLFDTPIFESFPSEHTQNYVHWWHQADTAYKAGPESANRVEERLYVHVELSDAADKVTSSQGFWPWAADTMNQLAVQTFQTFKPLIPHKHEQNATNELKHIYNLAMRLDVRLRTEPFYYTFDYFTHGVPWDHEDMVQRNPELAGHPCDQSPSIYVIRCCVTPQIKKRKFNDPDTVRSEIIRKAEVLLCPREKNLRKTNRPRMEFRL